MKNAQGALDKIIVVLSLAGGCDEDHRR